jgi:hypothetical protein
MPDGALVRARTSAPSRGSATWFFVARLWDGRKAASPTTLSTHLEVRILPDA